MATTLQWVGGGSNQASDPNDWIDTSTGLPAAPELDDALMVGSVPPGSAQSFTMNVRGDDLVGSSLGVGFSDLTANLSHRAFVNAYIDDSATTFNVSQQSTLNILLSHASTTVNLSQNSTLYLNPGYGDSTINVSGRNFLTIASDSAPGGVDVNLQQGARLSGTFVSPEDGVGMNGAQGSVFLNDGASFVEFPTDLNVDVAGKGSITVSYLMGLSGVPNLEFAKSVGHDQSVIDGGTVKIDTPDQFHASISLTSASSEVDLMGLANADSYTFKNDLLKIFACNNVIDTLRLTDQSPYGFDVVETAGSVNVVALSSSGETLSGALPAHHAWA